MVKKLFLTSTGLPPETAPVFLKLLGKNPKEAKVSFIPTAADPETDKWFVDAAKEQLTVLGFKFEEVDLKKNPKWIEKKLAAADIIYINGGNTFYLLYWIRKSKLDKYLSRFLDEGKIYVGSSAGSIIAGPNIESAGWGEIKDENLVNLKELTGLNIVPFAISPHYTEADRLLLKKKSKLVDYPIIAINDAQAVQIIGNDYKIVGKGEKIIFG